MPKVTVFYGLYGSGKSEISINYALRLKEEGFGSVVMIDLDAVTPYFRIRDVESSLAEKGIRVLSPKDSPRYSDLPILPQGVREAFGGEEDRVIVDLGGDPTGARVLGSLSDALPSSAEVLFVVNFMRPFSGTPQEAKKAIERVSGTSGVLPTGLVINNHLGPLTDISHVQKGSELGQELSDLTGLGIAFIAAPSWLKPQKDAILQFAGQKDVLWLERFLITPWEAPDN